MKILKLEEIEKKLPFNISKGLSMNYIREWIEEKYDIIDWDVYLPSKGINLQRGFVWTLHQKQELILSILKGIHIPPIVGIQYKPEGYQSGRKTILKIIDGKQRFSSILSFAKGEFPIIWEGEEYYIHQLDDWGQRKILLMMPTMDIAYEYHDYMISDEDKIKWFEMINFAGTPQDIEHLKSLKNGKQ